MALFKIEKGLKEKLSTNRPNAIEGYCYFTTNDGKFYIDIAGPEKNSKPLPAEIGVNRICLNADKADRDSEGNNIFNTYATKNDAVGNVTISNNSTIKVTKIGGGNNSFTIKDMTAPTNDSAGIHGLVPAAAAK